MLPPKSRPIVPQKWEFMESEEHQQLLGRNVNKYRRRIKPCLGEEEHAAEAE